MLLLSVRIGIRGFFMMWGMSRRGGAAGWLGGFDCAWLVVGVGGAGC